MIIKFLKIRSSSCILFFTLLTIVNPDICLGQVVFYDISENDEIDALVTATYFQNEIYIVSKTISTFTLSHIDSLGNIIHSKVIEPINGTDAMLADEHNIYMGQGSEDQSVLFIYDRLTLDLIDKLSFDFPFETTVVIPVDIQSYNSNKIVVSTIFREVDPPDYCNNEYGSIVILDKNNFTLDTIITFYDQAFCDHQVLGMKQIDNDFVVAVQRSMKWEDDIPFYANKDEMFIVTYDENFEEKGMASFQHQVFDPDFVWFDLFHKHDKCLTSKGEVIVPVRFGPYQCPYLGSVPGCIPYYSLLGYDKDTQDRRVLRNSFNTWSFSADIRSMLETDDHGLIFYGSSLAIFYPNYNYNVVDGMNLDLSDEPFVFTQTPIFIFENEDGNLDFRLLTILDEEYNSDLQNVEHLFQLANGDLVALGEGSQELSPTGARLKFGDVYAMFIDENFCVEGYGCIEKGHTDFISSVSDEDDLLESFKVYPNPSSDILNFKNDKNKEVVYKLYSSTGILVQSGIVLSSIDVSSIEAGLYFLEVHFSHSSIHSAKIVISK